MSTQLYLPGFQVEPSAVCPLCGQSAALFGQFSPFLPWGVCRDCCIRYPYPDDILIPSTRRNSAKEPLMVDPASSYERREKRIQLEEMLRCAVDPSRLERPVVKYNLSGLELRHPIRRSRAHLYQAWSVQVRRSSLTRQMSLPYCTRCGCAHDRRYEMLPGQVDYWSRCQRCEDELSVEALWRCRAIFGADDVESILDRLYAAHRGLFERGVLPDYWFQLMANLER